MNFSCDNCARKYSIADDRVGDKGVKIRCKHCQHVIVVKPSPVVGAEESTRMVSLEELERGGVAAPRSGSGGSSPSSGGGRAAKGGAAGGGRSQRKESAAPPSPATATSPGAASPWEGEATRAVVAPDPNAQWFAMVKGQQVGPFDLRGLSGKMKQGEVGLKTFVWREGMDDWKRAEELPEMALVFAGGASKEERGGQGQVKVEAVKSIAAALQKSAAVGMRTSAPKASRPGEPVEEPKRAPMAEASPDEMWPAEADPDNLDAPMAFDLSVDGSDAPVADAADVSSVPESQELDLMATAQTLAEAASAPVTPIPGAPSHGPAPAMSSAAAVTVSPTPTRRSPRSKSKDPAPAPPSKAETPAPAPAPAPAASTDLSSSDLFSDLDLRRSGEHQRPIDPGDLMKTADEPGHKGPNGAGGEANPSDDPFGKVGKIPAAMVPKLGQSTAYVIAQAGMNKRNPIWKIALFVVLLLGLPVGVLYALSELNVVPLQITHVDQATGAPVTETVFSKGGLSGLRDLLTGKKPPAAAPKDSPKGDAKGPKDRPAGGPGAPDDKQLAALYQDGTKKDVGPTAKNPTPDEPRDHEEPVGGPPKEEINKVVEATQRAFQFCIEQELKKNPAFKGGKVRLVATVGASGVVKKASIDREDIDQSELGECLKGKAKRMAFSAFSGDDVDLEIPLILSTAM